jgi:ribonuclease D
MKKSQGKCEASPNNYNDFLTNWNSIPIFRYQHQPNEVLIKVEVAALKQNTLRKRFTPLGMHGS